MPTQKVYRKGQYSVTVTIMQWGNGWRVKWVMSDNDPNKSRMINFRDRDYRDFTTAQTVYNDECADAKKWAVTP